MSKTSVDYGKPIPIRVDPDLLRRIEELSVKLGESKATVMRICLRLGLSAVGQLAQQDAYALLLQLNAPQSSAAVRARRYPSKLEGASVLNDDAPSSTKTEAGKMISEAFAAADATAPAPLPATYPRPRSKPRPPQPS